MESLFGSLPEMLDFQKVFLETLEDGISSSSDFNTLETPSQFRVTIWLFNTLQSAWKYFWKSGFRNSKFHMIALKFEALRWITDTYSALQDKFYFSQFYFPLSHGRGCNMEIQSRLWVCYKLAMLMMQNFFVERFLSLGWILPCPMLFPTMPSSPSTDCEHFLIKYHKFLVLWGPRSCRLCPRCAVSLMAASLGTCPNQTMSVPQRWSLCHRTGQDCWQVSWTLAAFCGANID